MFVHHRGRDPKEGNEKVHLATSRLKVFVWDEKNSTIAKAGFCFAADIFPTGASFYLDGKIRAGNFVRIAFGREAGASFQGSVLWCNRFSLQQGFIGKAAPSFRIGVRYRFGSEVERQRYLKFVEEVRRRVLAVQPGMIF